MVATISLQDFALQIVCRSCPGSIIIECAPLNLFSVQYVAVNLPVTRWRWLGCDFGRGIVWKVRIGGGEVCYCFCMQGVNDGGGPFRKSKLGLLLGSSSVLCNSS